MLLKKVYKEFSHLSEYLQSISLLLARLTLAYGFYEPATMKWKDMDSVGAWFGSIGIPSPTYAAYLVASSELIGVVLLVLGLFTRAATIPLIIIMIVAILAVHLPNGFSAANNGFEIPLYYMIFLLIFLSHGPGKFSLDKKILHGDT